MLKSKDVNPRVLDPSLDVMNFLNEIRERYPQAISLAAGRPYEEFFNTRQALSQIISYAERTAASHKRSTDSQLNALVQYGATNGIIRDELVNMLAVDEGIFVTAASVLVTVGCQEAMTICLMGLCDPGKDVLLISEPAYIGVTGTARLLGIDICPVSSNDSGLNLNDLEVKIASIRASGKRPKLLYDIPDYSNPSGTLMPIENRVKLLEIAKKNQILIMEDRAYSMFSYEENAPQSLKSLDMDKGVIYLGTFAKTLFPGLRMGFLVADQSIEIEGGKIVPLTEIFGKIKSQITVNTPPMNQAIVAEVLLAESGSLRNRNKLQVEFYKKNRDCLIRQLHIEFPRTEPWAAGITWNNPKGGFFLVLDLPFPVDDALLRRSAHEYGVIWVPMAYFYVSARENRQLRLSFSNVTTSELEEAIRRLGRLVRDHLKASEAEGH